MIPKYNKVHNKFKLNNYHYTSDSLMEVAYSFVKEGDDYEKEMGNFLLDWMDDNDYVEVSTSGSTGKPKHIKLNKQAMVHSAIATGDFFGLKPGDSALHCLPANYIAGKMMLVRAIVLGLEIDVVTPTSYSLDNAYRASYDFCAMVPMQLENSLVNINRIKKLIVGGTAVPKHLIDAIQNISTHVYETFGMTETITHIAARPLNHVNAPQHFKVFPNVTISKDDRGCLVIDAPHLNADNIVTNDVVEMHSTKEFKILGRADNVINSGGVKLFPEVIESKLESQIHSRFFVASEKDDFLGQALVLVTEGKQEIDINSFKGLDKYEIPKHIYHVDAFVETETKKIKRRETLELIKK